MGDVVEKKQEIVSVVEKESKTYGTVLFLKRRCVLQKASSSELLLEEELDHVYMLNTGYSPPEKELAFESPVLNGEKSPCWSESVTMDTAALFRYSALTWNSHRVHYDPEYATGKEAYPEVVVHGPLLCTLMLDMFQRRTGMNDGFTFTYRAVRPLFVSEKIGVWGLPHVDEGGEHVGVKMFATNSQQNVCMQAVAELGV